MDQFEIAVRGCGAGEVSPDRLRREDAYLQHGLANGCQARAGQSCHRNVVETDDRTVFRYAASTVRQGAYAAECCHIAEGGKGLKVFFLTQHLACEFSS